MDGILRIIVTLSGCHLAMRFETFSIDIYNQDVLTPTNYLSRETAISAVECGQKCREHADCASFFFTSMTSECQLEETVLDLGVVSTEYVLSTVYYTLSVSDICVLSATLQFPYYCPQPNGPWVETAPSFYARLLNKSANWDDASAMCASVGGFLPRLTSIEKMYWARFCFFTCGSAAGFHYWADASNRAADDPFATHAWKTSDGIMVPLDQGVYWVTGRPDNAGVDQCAMMRSDDDYQLDDVNCADQVMIVCESTPETLNQWKTATSGGGS